MIPVIGQTMRSRPFDSKAGVSTRTDKQVDIFLVQLSTDVRLENAETHSARDSSVGTVRRLEF